MNSKTDPYATKLHKQIDALLFVFILVVIALLLRPAAKGEMPVATAFSSVRPFWTTLSVFTWKTDADAATMLHYQGGYATSDGIGVLAALAPVSNGTNFSPIMVAENRKPTFAVGGQLEPNHRVKSDSTSSALSPLRQISGFGSALAGDAAGSAASNDGYLMAGTDARETSTPLSNAIEASPRYAGESSDLLATPKSNEGGPVAPEFNGGGSLTSTLSTLQSPTYASSAPSSSNPFAAKSQSGSFISKGISSQAPDQVAATFTWDGGGGDDNWGTPENWNPDGAPGTGTGTQIEFAGSTRLTPFWNYSAFDQMGLILFNSGAGAFTLNGTNAMKIFTKLENNSVTLQTVSISSIVLNGTTATEINPVSGDLAINSGLILDTPQLRVFGNNGKTVTFNGVIQNGSVTNPSVAINQNSTVVYKNAMTYTGDTFVNAGKLQFSTGGSAVNSTIRIGDTAGAAVNAEVDLTIAAGGQTLANTFNSRAGNAGTANIASQNTSGTNTLSGHIALDKALTITQAAGGTLNITQAKGGDNTTGDDIKNFTETFTPASAGLVDVSGTIYNSTGSGNVIMNGAGTLILSGTNTYSGTTTASSGILGIGNNSALGTSTLAFNGGAVTASGGSRTVTNVMTISGSGGTIGGSNDLTLNGSLTQSATSTLTISNTGNSTLGGTIDLNANSGTARTLTVNGSGNATFGGTVQNSFAGNNSSLTYSGTGALTLNGTNTYSGTTTVSSGTVNIGNNSAFGTSGLTLGGGTIAATGGARSISNSAIVSAGNGTIGGSNNLTFTGSFTNSGSDRTLTVNSSGLTTFGTVNLSNDNAARTLTITGSGNTTFGGVIQNGGTGAGSLTFNSGYSGTATINGNNTYSGATTLTGGSYSLVLGNKAAFGTSTVAINGISISANTDLSGANAIANAATIGGNNTFTGTNNLELSGGLTLTSNRTITNNMSAGTLRLSGTVGLSSNTNTNTLTLNGSGNTNISGVVANNGTGGTATSGNLTYGGTGVLTFSGTSANTYAGTTTINSGEIDLNKTAGVNAIAGNITLGDGSVTDTLKLLASNQIANTSDLTIASSGVFDLNGTSETIDALSASLAGASVTLGAGTLTVGANNETSASFAGVISGSGGALVKTGSGTQTLSGANTYTGGTTVSGGTLALGANNVLADAGALNVGGGTFDFNSRTDTVGALTLTGSGVLSGTSGTLTTSGVTVNGGSNALNGGTLIGNASFGSGAAFADNGALTGNATVGNGTLSGSGSISGTTGVTGGTINGSGLTLTGLVTFNGAGNTLSGTETATAGVSLASTASLTQSGTLTGNVTQGASSALTANGTVSGSDSLSSGATLAGTGTISGAISLAGSNTLSSGGTLTGGSTLAVSGLGNVISSGTISIAGTTTINTSSALKVTGILSGAGAVSVSGALSGTGTVSKLVTINSGGHLAPGNSVGTLTLASLTLSNGSILDYEFNNTPANDFTNVTTSGGLTLNGGGFNLYDDGTTNTYSTNGLYNLIGYNGTLNGSLSNLSVLNPVFGKSYTFGATGTNITLTIGNNAALAAAYWRGAIDSAWNSTSGTQSNFTTDLAGTINANQLVGATTDVFFTATNGTQVTTTLGQNFTINSLTFNNSATSASNISGNTLTLNAGSGAGITVQTGSGNHTISSNVALGANQTWTVADSGTTLTVSGNVSGSGKDLTKAGAGTLALRGTTDTYRNTIINGGTLDAGVGSLVNVSGSVTVNSGGTLLLSGTGRHIGAAVGMTLNGGTFNTAGLSEPATAGQSIGALTLSASSIIDLGSGASILAFAASNAQTWTGTLSIYNWSGNQTLGNGTDQLLFGSDTTGLTLGQLGSISFYSGAGSGFLGTAIFAPDLDGEVIPTLVAVPEPSTWAAAALALGAIAWTQRRRFTPALAKIRAGSAS